MHTSTAADVSCAGGARRGVLDARQRLVDGEHVGDMLRPLGLELIAEKPANGIEWMRSHRNEHEKANTDNGC